MENFWYLINNLSTIDSPALVIYKDRVKENIRRMINMAGGVQRLMPHVKTHKTLEVVKMQIQEGIKRFKCATIAEAEMIAMAGAGEALIAYQPVGPKMKRIRELIMNYPKTSFSVIVDNQGSAKIFSELMFGLSVKPGVYIDLNVGMDRTGIIPGKEAEELINFCLSLKNIKTMGFHAYDGHIRESDITEREAHCKKAFKTVYQLKSRLEKKYKINFILIAGGTPTFPIHSKNLETVCSPGTSVLWDYGYLDAFPDLDFILSALIISRVISKTGTNLVCLDLGYKAVASESQLPRVRFLNVSEANPVAHSEEHMVVNVIDNSKYKPGDVFYAIPKHICPTCALYSEAAIAVGSEINGFWKVIARDRIITI